MELLIVLIVVILVLIVWYVAFKTYTLTLVEFIRHALHKKGMIGAKGTQRRRRQDVLIYVIAALLVFFAMKSCLGSDMVGEHEYIYNPDTGEFNEIL